MDAKLNVLGETLASFSEGPLPSARFFAVRLLYQSIFGPHFHHRVRTVRGSISTCKTGTVLDANQPAEDGQKRNWSDMLKK
jgi:hypothetical protein